MKFPQTEAFLCARSKIESLLFGSSEIQPNPNPFLQKEGATFVTLLLNGTLRGCIGSLLAHRPLWEDLRENGYNAAFHDFRFAPLTADEYPHIIIEISVLTEPKPLQFASMEDLRSRIVPGRDGVIYSFQGYRATFLPQVWEQLPDFDQFFSHLSQKAGCGIDPQFDGSEIAVYQVDRYHE